MRTEIPYTFTVELLQSYSKNDLISEYQPSLNEVKFLGIIDDLLHSSKQLDNREEWIEKMGLGFFGNLSPRALYRYTTKWQYYDTQKIINNFIYWFEDPLTRKKRFLPEISG